MTSTAVQAGLILLREGLEAILVLAALAAFLRRAAPERGGALYWGAGAGLLASLAAAWAYWQWAGGAHDDRIEGVTCLVAAALMLWTGGWMARRSDPKAWAATLRRQAEAALAKERVALAVGAIGFLAVFREGAETALFLVALGSDSGAGPIILGLAVAALLLAGVWYAVMRAAIRLPLRPLFLGTSIFLLVMAARFAAAAVQEFQEQILIPFTPLDLPAWLEDLGIPTSLEGLIAAAAVFAIAALVLLTGRRASPRTAPAAAE